MIWRKGKSSTSSCARRSAVPSFYGHVNLAVIDPARAVHPPAILIEYIENAVTLKDVDARLLDHALIRSFIGAINIMGSLGVGNNALNPGNFLFAPAWKPSRILLIDWANAGIHEPHTTDEQWEEYVETNGTTDAVKRLIGRM